MTDEYISRAKARADFEACNAENPNWTPQRVKTLLLRQPAADVAPVRHGQWEQDADGDWYCTNCDEAVAICDSGKNRTYRKPYCPNCGARMDGGYEQ